MRNTQGFAPQNQSFMHGPSVKLALLVAVAMAVLAAYTAPRGFAARDTLTAQDDPASIADRALDTRFNADVARSGIETALAEKDADLAKSFVDLAAARDVALDPALIAKVDAAVQETASAKHVAERFALGLVTGEPDGTAGLAGSALGDLFVFGDVRDAIREGKRLAVGEPADKVVLGLACVGLAVTAGTYATFGATAPVRAGLTLAKVARKTGRLGADMADAIGRMLRGVVDWDRLKKAIAFTSAAEPTLALRAARESVKLGRTGGLVDLARNIGRVQAKAGTRAALEGLKLSQSPRDMARVAKLAEKEGSRTRAILKVLGRAAIVLPLFLFQSATSILGALFTVFMLVAALKSTVERTTLRIVRYRKERRRLRERRRFAALVSAREA